jgi:hypothetical protein
LNDEEGLTWGNAVDLTANLGFFFPVFAATREIILTAAGRQGTNPHAVQLMNPPDIDWQGTTVTNVQLPPTRPFAADEYVIVLKTSDGTSRSDPFTPVPAGCPNFVVASSSGSTHLLHWGQNVTLSAMGNPFPDYGSAGLRLATKVEWTGLSLPPMVDWSDWQVSNVPLPAAAPFPADVSPPGYLIEIETIDGSTCPSVRFLVREECTVPSARHRRPSHTRPLGHRAGRACSIISLRDRDLVKRRPRRDGPRRSTTRAVSSSPRSPPSSSARQPGPDRGRKAAVVAPG